jgi:homoserine O-acetyltransferase/O-succinyltransferase
MALYQKPAAAKVFRDGREFPLEFGGSLPELTVAYETWGELNSSRDNAVLICPAFSAHSHARSHADDPNPGWWEEMIGANRGLDPERFFIICPSLLGSCYGTTGPLSQNPKTGEPYQGDFPEVSIKDITNAHVRLLDGLGISTLYGSVGGSMGGMQTLELAVSHPERVRRVASFSATTHTRAFTSMIRHVGRRAILMDPDFQGGFYGQRPPEKGLRLAREIGTIFYRSREEFNRRFSCRPVDPNRPPKLTENSFDFQNYLDHQAQKIVPIFDVNSYLRLSFAMDLHDLSHGHASLEAALDRIEAELLIVGVTQDRLIPIDEQLDLRDRLLAAGKTVHWREISSEVGHDAFLKEFDALGVLMREFF